MVGHFLTFDLFHLIVGWSHGFECYSSVQKEVCYLPALQTNLNNLQDCLIFSFLTSSWRGSSVGMLGLDNSYGMGICYCWLGNGWAVLIVVTSLVDFLQCPECPFELKFCKQHCQSALLWFALLLTRLVEVLFLKMNMWCKTLASVQREEVLCCKVFWSVYQSSWNALRWLVSNHCETMAKLKVD